MDDVRIREERTQALMEEGIQPTAKILIVIESETNSIRLEVEEGVVEFVSLGSKGPIATPLMLPGEKLVMQFQLQYPMHPDMEDGGVMEDEDEEDVEDEDEDDESSEETDSGS